MARPIRIEYPGAIYHITSRGNAQLPIYEINHDRKIFLGVLGEVVDRYNWLCHAYCLMDNHYHLLVETPDGNLSLGMRHLNGVYTQRFNKRHKRVGHVFQGRFKSILVEQDSYLLELCRYVVLNPIRAGLIKSPENYRWSSFGATSGFTKTAPFLTVDWILGQFGNNRVEAQKEYRRFVKSGIEGNSSPWQELKSQCILGSKSFIEKLTPSLKDKSDIKEIPKEQRLAFRPSLNDLFPPDEIMKSGDRNEIIQRAHFEYGYTLTEIAKHVGLHYSTIGRIVKK